MPTALVCVLCVLCVWLLGYWVLLDNQDGVSALDDCGVMSGLSG